MVAGAIIASATPSAVSWLYFANRLIELPLGIVGVAMGTVLVPELTRAVRSGDRDAVAHAESRALELATGLALPATLGLIVLAEPIVRLLFEHGAFGADDSTATAHALMWLALGTAGSCADQGAVAGLLCPQRHDDAAAGDRQGLRGRGRPRCRARTVFGASGIAASIAAGAWSSAISLLRKGTANSASRSMRPPATGCRGSCSPRLPWARLLWLDDRSDARRGAWADPLHRPGRADRSRNRRLWRAPADPRRGRRGARRLTR